MSLQASQNLEAKPKNALKGKAVIYARVSSVKQKVVGDGLNSQITRCEEYAKYKNYEIVEVFKDDISGGLIERPAMQSMLSFLSKHRKDNTVVIIDDISRLARGIEAHLHLRSAIASAGGTLESPSIEFGEDSDSQLVENLLAVVSQHQRQKNGEQTKNRMRGRVMNGYWVFAAPLGYRYERVAGHGKLLVRHEPMASIIQEALEGFASGRFQTQSEVMHYLETLPHFPRDGRGLIRTQRVKNMLKNPIYAGMIERPNWDVPSRKGHHEPLINYSTHLKNLERLKPKAVAIAPHRKNFDDDFVLRGFITCGECGLSLTACWSKGRYKKYPYYLCHNKACSCFGKSIPRAKLEGEFEQVVRTLMPSEILIKAGFAMFKEHWAHRLDGLKRQFTSMQIQLKQSDKEIEALLDRIVEAESPTVIKAYEKKISKLETNKLVLAEKAKEMTKPVSSFESNLRTAIEFLLNPLKLWGSDNIKEKRILLKLAFLGKIAYDRETGLRTAVPSLPFQVIQMLSDGLKGNVTPEEVMVRPAGLEPATR